jgi:glycosyltransferase involved in cell wall biosynthesis
VKVVHVNSYDRSGGAARAAYRLHEGLRNLGVDSGMFVLHKDTDDSSVTTYNPPANLTVRLGRVLRRKAIARDVRRYQRARPGVANARDPRWNFSDDRAAFGRDPWSRFPGCDIIHLHWVVGFLDYREFFGRIPERHPVAWTLHDMNPFTGGCHWACDCERFAQQCGACPLLASQSVRDLSHRIWQRKQDSFSRLPSSQLHIITPSHWLCQQASRSSLLSRFPISVIPYGLDTELFAPREKRIAREILKLPPKAKVVLFVADGVHLPRKGFELLKQALVDLLNTRDLYLVSMGRTDNRALGDLSHVHIDYLRHEGVLSCVYSAADVFVAPSLEDNLPNTVLEAISCGVPVVGFAVGGIPDAVRPGITGLLAPRGDIGALRNAILELVEDEARRSQMSANCRSVAVEEYSLEVQAREYLRLYEEMLIANSNARTT